MSHTDWARILECWNEVETACDRALPSGTAFGLGVAKDELVALHASVDGSLDRQQEGDV